MATTCRQLLANCRSNRKAISFGLSAIGAFQVVYRVFFPTMSSTSLKPAQHEARSSKLKVLCFGRFCDEMPGGTQSHVESLCDSLEGSVQFVNLVPSRDRKTAVFFNGLTQVYRMAGRPLGGSVSVSWRMIFKAISLHRQHKFDLVHLHFPDPMSHLASLFIPWSVPRVISWHSDILRQRKLLFFYKPFLRAALNSASVVTVATPAHVTSSEFLHFLRDKSRLKVVPYGIDYKRFQSDASLPMTRLEAIQALAGQRSVVFALGRHVYYKGFDVLINAMADAKHKCFLILGGDGPLTPALQKQVEDLKLQDSVHFAGFIPDEELPAWFAAADIFCLPSIAKTEAFGIVQLEAMAAGKPVVSSALKNGVDYVNQHQKTGFVVNPSDPVSLTQALTTLADNPELQQSFGLSGRSRVEQFFSKQRMAEMTLAAYHSALALKDQVSD